MLIVCSSAPNPDDVDAFKSVLDHEINKVQSKLEEFSNFLKRFKVKNGRAVHKLLYYEWAIFQSSTRDKWYGDILKQHPRYMIHME